MLWWFIICGFQEDDAPQFWKIYDILTVEKEVAIHCVRLYLTKGKYHHYHSYVITETEENEVICVWDKNKLICSLHPLQAHSLLSMLETLFIVTKCFIFRTWKFLIMLLYRPWIWLLMSHMFNMYTCNKYGMSFYIFIMWHIFAFTW